MERRTTAWYSPNLNMEMPLVAYGHAGPPLLMFPTAAADYLEYERFYLVDAIKSFIEEGKLRAYSINSVNRYSLLNEQMPPNLKAELLTRYDRYITDDDAVVYRPVEVRGRQLIDGGIRSTTNVDVAVEQGAKFIVVVNPLVPYVNDFQKRIPTIFGSRVRRVSDMGYPQVGYQAFKLLAHARLHEHVKHWRERYPGVDIILIEPDPNDELMFGTSIMNYSSRIEIARHGFESVTLRLAQDYRHYKQICEKHGIEISARRVTKILRQAEEQREKTTAWRTRQPELV